MRVIGVLLATILFLAALSAESREVAITIDDLPRGGDGGSTSLADVLAMTEKLMTPFRREGIPVIGFVNEGRIPELGSDGLRQVLNVWLAAGADLGNHSRSHWDLNEVPLEKYTADIIGGERVLREVLAARGKKLEFFRHPFLHTGPTLTVKQGLQAFLDGRGYRVAPVTFDDADYAFAALYTRPEFEERVRRTYLPYMESVVAFFERRSVEVIGREPPQILLIHASQLNADMMPKLLAMFRRRGYSFISLERALADAAYAQADGYVDTNGVSWISRWAATRGMPRKDEPDPPPWVLANFGND